MAKHIKGNKDGKNGENVTCTIRGRGTVAMNKLVKETKTGKHPNHHVVKRAGKEFIRSNPDKTTNNNVG